ncbi:ornithine cyclodeaminase [Rhodococcus opacus PD630]|uniref:ornithine cyclodeaminase n=1 Tax=Rhodococcus opacus TaxID=37919 RepID=UPI00029CC9A0|nr:ornithine cyclodeaminase [Rhodococcus opacus]AHK35977.1 Ornithine cyclodeaminase [Rhodococcus opacus PD630]EHI43518.1 ornithine cyclodeaminase [Rhodococcus opacus PD630]
MTDPASTLILTASDLDNVEVTSGDVLSAVETAYQALASGASINPGKLTVAPGDRRSVAYSMLARDGHSQTVAFKTSFKFDPHRDRIRKRYYTTLSLYDDTTGEPIALMDCGRVGALRTPAVSGLLIRACAAPDASTILVVGSGTQGRFALPLALAAHPQFTDLELFATHPDGIAAVQDELARQCPGRTVRISTDLEESVRHADVILAVAGEATPAHIRSEWIKPGAVTILVGYGLSASTLSDADYVVATSAEQMRTTGTDMAGPDGVLRGVDAELPDILAGRAVARRTPHDRVFAYNSGLVVTDIALGLLLVGKAREQGLGSTLDLWS